jgi:hypothetical protein
VSFVESLRNPFALKHGSIILIEDLDISQRGLKCQCKCPACGGDFIAKMGDVKVHHFAHSKDACDEVVAYTSGLYRLIHQILSGGAQFYIPALIVSYTFPDDGFIPEDDIESCLKLVHERYNGANRLDVLKGKSIAFDCVDLCVDNKNRIEALELTVNGSKMAIKVMPPDTVCKTGTVSRHKDMATLVVDFTDDADIIQTSNTKSFREYLLSKRLSKRWIYNPKVEKVFPRVIELSRKARADYIERQKTLAELKKAAAQECAEQMERMRKADAKKRITDETSNKLRRQERLVLGFSQVKDKFTQQDTPIRDSTGLRWVECELCGEIKDETEFSSYGGSNHANLGICSKCNRSPHC